MKKMIKLKSIMMMLGIVVIAAAIFFGFIACDGPENPVPPAESEDATLSGITIKGVAVSDRGTPHATIGSETAGTLTVTGDDSGTTGGAVTNAKASVTKIVKYAGGDSSTYAATFTADSAYNNQAITDGDFFVFEVTAENGDKLYYRIDVTVVGFMHNLTEANVADETDFTKVRFYVYDKLFTSGFYNTITYAQVRAALGDPVTAIDSNNAGRYLYAVEFTAAGSGTVVRFGVSSSTLEGNDSDEDIAITLTGAVDPPPPPSAAIEGGDVYVEARKANLGGTGAVAANAEITINLTNATVNGALSQVNAALWFSKPIAGLTYTADAEDDNTIVITISGEPTAVSTETSEITIPAGVIKDDKDAPNTEPLQVSGNVKYDIDEAPNPEITDFSFTPEEDLIQGSPAVEADATLGVFRDVVGGTVGEYIFALTTDNNYENNNTLFEIEGANLKVGAAPLTVVRTYQVEVIVTDAAGETFTKTFDLIVNAAELSGFTFTPAENLEVGSGLNTIVGNFSDPVGGQGPYTYSLVSGEGDTDNASFSIYGEDLRSRNALTEPKTYSVRVQVQDMSPTPQTFARVLTFTVKYPAALPASAAVSESYDGSIDALINNSEGVGAQAANESIRIELTNSMVKEEITANTDVSLWFSPLVEGLNYKIPASVSAYSSYIEIAVSGMPTEIFQAAVTITIPANMLLDSNGYPTIEDGVVVGGREVSYAITAAPEDVVKIGEQEFTSLQAAISSITDSNPTTITVIKDIELSSTVIIPSNRWIILDAETDGLTISPADGFTYSLFRVSANGTLELDEDPTADGNPVLIIDGKGKEQLIAVTESARLYLRNAELRNADYAVILYGTVNRSISFFMNGGVIAGNGTGVWVRQYCDFYMSGGIIYGADGSENANTAASVSLESDTARFTFNSESKGTGPQNFTETFDLTTP